MQTIQIDGTYTYAQTIKTLKIGSIIKLIPNPENKMNKNAIGAYTICGKKIGYIPFTINQIDINAKYIVAKINLSKLNPILLIAIEWPITNSIHCEPSCITNKKTICAYFIDIPEELTKDLQKIAKDLEKSGNDIKKIGICELTDSNITICIQTQTSTNFFYTVTKSFYDSNIFKYDEFFKFGLIPKCIYKSCHTHRLEKYIEFNYKPSNKFFSDDKFKIDKFIDFLKPNYGMDLIKSNDLILFNKKKISKQINSSDLEDWIKLTILYNTNLNEYYNPDHLIPDSLAAVNLTHLNLLFDNLEPGGLFYNHELCVYCSIDLIDPINIIEIFIGNEIPQPYLIELIGKLIISNKQIINVFNPLIGTIYRLKITDEIKSEFNNIYIR